MAANSGPDLEVKRKEQAAPAAIDGGKYSMQSNSTVETSPMTDRHPSAFLQCLDPDCQRENWSLSWLCPNMQTGLVPVIQPFNWKILSILVSHVLLAVLVLTASDLGESDQPVCWS